MSFVETVTEAAKTLKLLDGSGNLVVLDSLSLLDLITELENKTDIVIPASEMRAEVFRSIDSVAELLTRLSTTS